MTRLLIAALSLAAAGTFPAEAARRPADAPQRFDGTWSVEIITESGTCDRAYRYPVRIEGGRARFVGTAFVIDGSIAGSGRLRGSISNGSVTAAIVGRLGADGTGTGTWVASGGLDCRGRWNAERRG